MEPSGHLGSMSWNFCPEGSLKPAEHHVAHKPPGFPSDHMVSPPPQRVACFLAVGSSCLSPGDGQSVSRSDTFNGGDRNLPRAWDR